MKIAAILLAFLLLTRPDLNAQGGANELTFACLLNKAQLHVDSASIRMYGTEERKMIISSETDSLVKAPASGVVYTVQRDSDGSYDIVFSHEDFYFWLSGIQKPLVRARQNLEKGQPLGVLRTGAKLEILLFENETPADPAEYLPCALPGN